ncbi:MAG: hypothetical protein V3U57_00825 [Robiginitomaculum sp.]
MEHNKKYAAKIKALGLSQRKFALHPLVDVDPGTISRHISGEISPIPNRFWNTLIWMDKGKVDMS